MKSTLQNRRQFQKFAGVVACETAFVPALLSASPEEQVDRRVLAMSDLHIGKVDDGRDGAEWLQRALADVAENIPDIDFGLTLGDIAQNGDVEGIGFYLSQTRGHRIPKWFELAGNHEYYHGNIGNYTSMIRSTDPLLHLDGNVAWFFLSDEKESREGNLSAATLAWLEKGLSRHRGKNIVVCSHQLVANTVRRSDDPLFQLHPVDGLQKILENHSVDLWMCGHEHHHHPYTREKIVRENGTTFVNVASINHAYGTTQSGSVVLDFKNGAREIRLRRRDHDHRRYLDAFETSVPLRVACRLPK